MSSQGQYIRLETTGRKTGKPHHVLLRFVTIEGRIVVFPQTKSIQDWVLNLKSNPKVRVHNEGRVIQGTASLNRVRGPSDPLLSVFSRKYGDLAVAAIYWGQQNYVEIKPAEEASTEDYYELVYADLEAAFDGVAEDYDRHILGNPINVWLRNRSVSLMTKVFRAGETVLEVGCGTGTETLSLAKTGITVLATDISSKMLRVLKRKVENAGLDRFVIPIHARPYTLMERIRDLGYETIDGAYSTYGAINTEPRLNDFFSGIRQLIKPQGRLVLGVWNKFCAYEILGYTIKLRPAMAGARFRNPVPVGKSRFCVASNAYTVSELSNLTSRYFRLENVYGVGIFLPPSNLTKYLPPEPILGLVKRIDVALEARFPWNRLGDHFLGVYVRNG